MSPTASRVPRPTKTTEYVVVFAASGAERRWRDLCATQRNALVDAWDLLTKEPLTATPKAHPLRGPLQWIVRDGVRHEQWQLELSGGARIWYYVDGRDVHLVQVHTRHPNQTK